MSGLRRHAVRWSAQARDDLLRLHEFLLQRADTPEDLDPDRAVEALEHAATQQLGRTPWIFRRAGADPLQRELLVPFGRSGYLLRYRIADDGGVLVLAARHQREDDYL